MTGHGSPTSRVAPLPRLIKAQRIAAHAGADRLLFALAILLLHSALILSECVAQDAITIQPARPRATVPTTPLGNTPRQPEPPQLAPRSAIPAAGAPTVLSPSDGSPADQRVQAAIPDLNGPLGAPPKDEFRLRIAWGGGAAKAWQGRIVIKRAQVVAHRSLGMMADSPGASKVSAAEILIHQRQPQSYDGVDLTLRGSVDSELHIHLQESSATGAIGKPHQLRVNIKEMLRSYRNIKLDDKGNQLLVRRPPGDWLQLGMHEGAMLFEPGQKITLRPRVDRSKFDKGSHCRLRFSMAPAKGGREQFIIERGFDPDENGSAEVEPIELTLPELEGVYNIRCVATIRRMVAVPFAKETEQSRELQFVVLGDQPIGATATEWQLVDSFDPANPSWRQWVNRLPGVRNLPGFDPQTPLGNSKMQPITHLGQQWVELRAQGWQAFPLPTRQPGRPHLVEIEYPADVKQSLGISVLQSNLANYLAPPNQDAGLRTIPELAEFQDPSQRVRTVRLVFWPHRAGPLLMLTNHLKTSAIFGKIRIYAGPPTLPSMAPGIGSRLAAAYFEKPQFPENFAALEARDRARNITLDDWTTFYDGSSRLVQYLGYSGYNAAIVNVAREGGAIFPSRTLQPTPKYDTGVFFVTGQDPQQKDALELMFRMFDRKKMRLIPSIHFSGTLPAVEQLRNQGERSIGLELIGAEGIPQQRRDGVPSYNPLNPRVREAMRAVVAELVTRYGHHPSFGGIAIQLDPESYAQLPNEFWGLDDATVSRFEQATGKSLDDGSEQGRERFSKRARVQGEIADAWIAWRASEMTKLYRAFAAEVRRRRLDTRLVLVGANMFDGAASAKALAPRVLAPPPFESTSLRMGIDASLLRDADQGIVLLQPRKPASTTQLDQLGLMDTLDSTEATNYFGQSTASGGPFGVVIHSSPVVRTLPDFDQANPFGGRRSFTKISSILTAGGPSARKPLSASLARSDVQWVVHGGELLTMGQEEHMRSWLKSFTDLPEAPFKDVVPESPGKTQPVLIREAVVGPKKCVYLMNNSPWELETNVRLSMASGVRIVGADGAFVGGLQNNVNGASWNTKLPPFGLQVVWLTSAEARVLDWQVTLPANVAPTIRQQLHELGRRAQLLQNPVPLRTLANGEFEQERPLASTPPVPAWQVMARDGEAQLDAKVFKNGARSVHLTCTKQEGFVRLVSAPIPAPSTGKLYLFVWLKVQDPDKQPKLKVSVRSENGYSHQYTVGAGQRFRIRDDWGDGFLFPFDNIPVESKKVSIEFTLLGEGSVWVDGVKPYDYWFSSEERIKLINRIGQAGFDLEKRETVSDSLEFLNSYWSHFLMNHVAAPAAAVAKATQTDQPTNRTAPRNPVGRIRDLVPLKLPKLKR